MSFATFATKKARAKVGFILLRSDYTLESDIRSGCDADSYVTRLKTACTVSTQTLKDASCGIEEAAKTLPPALDVVVYACTSGAVCAGIDVVHAAMTRVHPSAHPTNPFSAALARFRSLNVRTIDLVVPYVEDVTRALMDAFASNGVATEGVLSFCEPSEEMVARIAVESIHEAVRRVDTPASQCIFVSCTNLDCLFALESWSAELRKPVLSSNHVLLWHVENSLRQKREDHDAL